MERMVYEFEHGRIKPTNDTTSSPDNENRPSIGEGGGDEDVEAEFNGHQENDVTPPSQIIAHDDENRGRRRIDEDDEEETEMTFDDNDGNDNVPMQNDSPEHSSEQIVNDDPTPKSKETTLEDENSAPIQNSPIQHSSEQIVNDGRDALAQTENMK